MDINTTTTRGDYIFYEWNEGSCDALETKKEELEGLGYKLVNDKFGFVNQYFYYENDAGDKKMLTFCYR